MVNTGEGKGKTSAAVGVLLRAWGRGLRVCMIQFIKSADVGSGEAQAAAKLGIEWHISGDGYVWPDRDAEGSKRCAERGWQTAREKISGGEYDLVILDEFTFPLHFGWLDPAGVVDWLARNKPPRMHLIVTGRYAPAALIEYADTVTEMKLIKHAYDQGIQGQPGIEF